MILPIGPGKGPKLESNGDIMTAVQPSSYDQYKNDVLSGKTGSDLATDFWKALGDPNTTTTEKSAMLDVLSGQTHGTMDSKTAAAELTLAEDTSKMAEPVATAAAAIVAGLETHDTPSQ
jgi:hypothetical protein